MKKKNENYSVDDFQDRIPKQSEMQDIPELVSIELMNQINLLPL